jgi:hypothetical protein
MERILMLGHLLCCGTRPMQAAVQPVIGQAPAGRAGSWAPGPLARDRAAHSQRMPATGYSVLCRALEFDPSFLGGKLSGDFVLRSMR